MQGSYKPSQWSQALADSRIQVDLRAILTLPLGVPTTLCMGRPALLPLVGSQNIRLFGSFFGSSHSLGGAISDYLL